MPVDRKRRTFQAALAAAMLLHPCGGEAAQAPAPTVLTVYSDRHSEDDKLLFASFTKETGIQIALIDDEPEVLMQRLHDEGPKSPADLMLWVGVADLAQAAESDMLRPIDSDTTVQAVPDSLRDAKRRWVTLDWWARVIAYRKDRFDAADLARYEDLADPKLQGQILVRSSSSPYNRALLATMVAADGAEQAEDWARGLVQNLARPPQGGDTSQIEGLSGGEGGVALINTRYWARLAASDKVTEQELLEGLGLVFPNQDDRGTAIDGSCAGIPRSAPHERAAERLLEYLLRPDIQEKLAAADFDYPARAGVAIPATLPPLAGVKIDWAGLAKLGTFVVEAGRASEKAGWE